MQESKYNGDVVLTGPVKPGEIVEAFKRPDNKSVALHKPGNRVERWVKGQRQVWEVLEDGSWQRVDRRDATDVRAAPYRRENP